MKTKNQTISTSAVCAFLAVLMLCNSVVAQMRNHKIRAPFGIFQKDSLTIDGISVGLWSINQNSRHTKTNGVRVELIGLGVVMPLISRSPVVETKEGFMKVKSMPLSEQVNGLNLSGTGTLCDCKINGLTAGLIGQINFQVNGISTSLYGNLSQKHNGLMAAFGFNEAFYVNGLQMGMGNTGYITKGVQLGFMGNYANEMTGLQIGLFNESKHLKGLQLGLWNVTNKRKLPLVNWGW
ncbi:MAG: hypothetical protein CFE24_01000 [Flavobacterium sp. BFFFF2]|nr:MAG: hypothetical protein CFE24_01000 [Flavobacterium sp. BFFFF2]